MNLRSELIDAIRACHAACSAYNEPFPRAEERVRWARVQACTSRRAEAREALRLSSEAREYVIKHCLFERWNNAHVVPFRCTVLCKSISEAEAAADAYVRAQFPTRQDPIVVRILGEDGTSSTMRVGPSEKRVSA